MPQLPLLFGEWRPDIALLDNAFASVAENVYAGANSYLPVRGLAAAAAQSLADGGGNDSKTKILLHFNGTDASTTITDDNAGGSAHTWTAAGNAQIDTAQSVFGGASGLFDGTGDWVTTGDHADFTLGTEWRFDARLRPTTSGTLIYFGGQGNSTPTASSSSVIFSRGTSNLITCEVSNGTSFTTLTGTTAVLGGAWSAVTVALASSVLSLYVNGAVDGTAAFSGAVNDSAEDFRIGAGGERTTNPWDGWIDEVRLQVGAGTAPTAAFTVSTSPFWEGGDCVGLTLARTASGSFVIFAGTAERLFKWSGAVWVDVSRPAGGVYAVPAGHQWSFAQFGTTLIATNGVDAVQSINVDSGTTFAALAGSPPIASHVAVIGDFVVLSGLASNNRKIQWSAINDSTGWTIGTGLSDEQEFPDGGPVQGVAGGEVGYVVQDNSIRAMQFLPGDTVNIFSFSRLNQERGCIARRGFCYAAGALYFLDEDGFDAMSGPQLMHIGANKVDEWFLANSDAARRDQVFCFPIPQRPRVAWAYHSSAAVDDYDRLIVYDFSIQRWMLVIESAQTWAALAPTGTDLDTDIDAADISLDGSAASLDSAIYQSAAARPVAAAINPTGYLSFLDGPHLAATIETAEGHLNPEGRAFVSGVYPMVDAEDCTITVSTRERLQDTATWGVPVPLERTGMAPILSSARLHRLRVSVPAAETWTHAIGVRVEAQADGET